MGGDGCTGGGDVKEEEEVAAELQQSVKMLMRK